ncbi:MAG: ATP-binding cassette domain-containing protein [Puniceicoccaceae bacterium]
MSKRNEPTLSASNSTARKVKVEIEAVSIQFGDHKVVQDINLVIEPGEIFAIMGASGAGKSVLLRTVIGLLRPTSGRVLIDGMDAADKSTHENIRTTMVFQAGALFNSMSVFDNLAFYPREHHLYPEKTIRERVMETLRILSLENAAQKLPAELSGGMRKRVSIARALMMEPQLLLYDEPTSELDPIMAATISEIIATLRNETGVTSIVVTHDRDLAEAISDRIALLHHGKLLTVQSPEELRSNPDPIVQDFLSPEINIEEPRFKKL